MDHKNDLIVTLVDDGSQLNNLIFVIQTMLKCVGSPTLLESKMIDYSRCRFIVRPTGVRITDLSSEFPIEMSDLLMVSGNWMPINRINGGELG